MANTLNWTNRQVIDAHNEAMRFKSGDYSGALKYKAASVVRALAPAVKDIRESATELVAKFQREVGDPPRKIPAFQDGKQLPVEVWCTDVPTYSQQDRELMETKQEIHIPVRFTHAELATLTGVRGEFFDAMYDLIDAPADAAPAARP